MFPEMRHLSQALATIICLVWLTNGLFFKILNFVPRHQAIVSHILGYEYAYAATKAIGMGEILIVAWIVSGIKPRYCAIFQMILVAIMNIVEYFLVPDLLLFGELNIVVAFIFITTIFVNEFVLRHRVAQHNRISK